MLGRQKSKVKDKDRTSKISTRILSKGKYQQGKFTSYQFNAPSNQQGTLHFFRWQLGGWDQLTQWADHRQATIPLASCGIVLQYLKTRGLYKHQSAKILPDSNAGMWQLLTTTEKLNITLYKIQLNALFWYCFVKKAGPWTWTCPELMMFLPVRLIRGYKFLLLYMVLDLSSWKKFDCLKTTDLKPYCLESHFDSGTFILFHKVFWMFIFLRSRKEYLYSYIVYGD